MDREFCNYIVKNKLSREKKQKSEEKENTDHCRWWRKP